MQDLGREPANLLPSRETLWVCHPRRSGGFIQVRPGNTAQPGLRQHRVAPVRLAPHAGLLRIGEGYAQQEERAAQILLGGPSAYRPRRAARSQPLRTCVPFTAHHGFLMAKSL
jgi:hypothetical protein